MSTPLTQPVIDDHAQRVLRVLVLIRSRLESDLSLTSLAAAAHLSPFHFQRVFKAAVGESPKAYTLRLRLERAAVELRDTTGVVTDIARRAGHARVESFGRAFRAMFGETPAAYRRRHAAVEAPPMPGSLRVWTTLNGDDGQLYQRLSAAADPHRALRCVRFMPVRALFVRRVGRLEAEGLADWRRLGAFAQERDRGRKGAGGAARGWLMVSLHHGDERVTAASVREVDHCVVVGPRRRGEGEIGSQLVAGGEFAVVTVQGGAEDVGRARRWLCCSAPALLQRPRRPGPVIEVPLWDVLSEEVPRSGRLTDLLLPISGPHTPAMVYFRRVRPDLD